MVDEMVFGRENWVLSSNLLSVVVRCKRGVPKKDHLLLAERGSVGQEAVD